MLYLTCTTITSVDLAHNGVSRAKDWEPVDCGTRFLNGHFGQTFVCSIMASMKTLEIMV